MYYNLQYYEKLFCQCGCCGRSIDWKVSHSPKTLKKCWFLFICVDHCVIVDFIIPLLLMTMIVITIIIYLMIIVNMTMTHIINFFLSYRLQKITSLGSLVRAGSIKKRFLGVGCTQRHHINIGHRRTIRQSQNTRIDL